MIVTSQGEKSKNIRQLAEKSSHLTTSDMNRLKTLDELGARIDKMLSFVYGYTQICDDSVNTDDEIINWTFVDVSDDLNAALWNLTTGFYKAAASCLRNALDMAMASLYFQARENLYPKIGSYNEIFSEWDQGNRQTPSWGEMKTIVNKLSGVTSFNARFSFDIVNAIQEYFYYLSNFTHGRPYEPTGMLPTNSINMGANAPEFHEDLFDRIVDLTKQTIGWICTIWLVAYPSILKANPLGDAFTLSDYRRLFYLDVGSKVLSFASKD